MANGGVAWSGSKKAVRKVPWAWAGGVWTKTGSVDCGSVASNCGGKLRCCVHGHRGGIPTTYLCTSRWSFRIRHICVRCGLRPCTNDFVPAAQPRLHSPNFHPRCGNVSQVREQHYRFLWLMPLIFKTYHNLTATEPNMIHLSFWSLESPLLPAVDESDCQRMRDSKFSLWKFCDIMRWVYCTLWNL